jgi:hypothetical protein
MTWPRSPPADVSGRTEHRESGTKGYRPSRPQRRNRVDRDIARPQLSYRRFGGAHAGGWGHVPGLARYRGVDRFVYGLGDRFVHGLGPVAERWLLEQRAAVWPSLHIGW